MIQPDTNSIIEAAIERFARDGFDAPLRAVASDAGVSAALLIKKFGSKEKLRESCDETVLQRIRDVKESSIRSAAAGDLLGALSSSPEHAPLLGYTLQSVLHGGQMGRVFIDHMIDDAVEYMAKAVAQGVAHPSIDEYARARYLVLSGVGAFVLTMLLDSPDDSTDLQNLTRRIQRQLTPTMLEVFTHGVFTDRQMLDDYLLYLSGKPESPERASEGDTHGESN